MTTRPVTLKRIQIAKNYGLTNVEAAAKASRKTGLPFWAACALLEKESGGANVWGGADASPYSIMNRLRIPVNKDTFTVFYIGVKASHVPTGVGPCQITYAGALKNGVRDGGYFRVMEERKLRPWVPRENMEFGFEILWGHYQKHGQSWVNAGRLYNGAESYGEDLLDKCRLWKDRLKVSGSVNS